jgi:hypothetical protein
MRAVLVVLLALLALGATAQGGGAVPTATSACKPGVTTIKGFQARVFCGPAKVAAVVNGKKYVIKNGVCERYPTYFLINIGTTVLGIGKNRPELPYFGLLMGRSPAYSEPPVNTPGTYHKGLITIDVPGVHEHLHNEPDLKIVLKAGLKSGTFSASRPAQYGDKALKVSGAFSC